jgi:hypothetical protein
MARNQPSMRSALEGQGLVEYALILILVAMVVVVVLPPTANAITAAYGLVVAAF